MVLVRNLIIPILLHYMLHSTSSSSQSYHTGVYENGALTVIAMGMPPLESSEMSREAFVGVNFFGGRYELADEVGRALLRNAELRNAL